MKAKFGQFIASLGTVCSSWIAMSRGSTKRDYLVVPGCTEYSAVRAGNLMVSRTAGVALRVTAREGSQGTVPNLEEH